MPGLTDIDHCFVDVFATEMNLTYKIPFRIPHLALPDLLCLIQFMSV